VKHSSGSYSPGGATLFSTTYKNTVDMCFVRLKSSTLHDTPPNLVKDRLVTWLLQSGMDYVLTWTFTHY